MGRYNKPLPEIETINESEVKLSELDGPIVITAPIGKEEMNPACVNESYLADPCDGESVGLSIGLSYQYCGWLDNWRIESHITI